MIPKTAFISAEKKVIPHTPEKKIQLIPYNAAQWKRYFGVQNRELQLTNIGTYSIARPRMGTRLVQFIKSLIRADYKSLVITETHGGLGGFTVPLARAFQKVQPVEIEEVHAEIIANNAGVLGCRNVEVHMGDYMEIANSLHQDVIVSDPPWGGPDYVSKKNIKLGINNVNIVHFINEAAAHKSCRLFVLLAPHNYDFNDFFTSLDPALIKHVRIEYVDPKAASHFLVGVLIP